jgi:septum formation protein
VRDGNTLFEHLSEAHITMRALTDSEISDYLDMAGDAVLSSVGCYQVEGIGIRLVESIDGDHATILGLPLLPLLAFMRDHKLLSF